MIIDYEIKVLKKRLERLVNTGMLTKEQAEQWIKDWAEETVNTKDWKKGS